MNRQQRRATKKRDRLAPKPKVGNFLAMIYAAPPWSQRRVHAANVWDYSLAEEIAFLIVNGWRNFRVKVHEGEGRPILFFWRQPPGSIWEKFYDAHDVEAIAKARKKLCSCGGTGDLCPTCGHRPDCGVHDLECQSVAVAR
jgi:hypothetical protein